MTFAKSISAALALSLVVAAPAAAQTRPMGTTRTTTSMETMSTMQQYCADTASRTDDAGRAWYAANCSPEMLARYNRPVLGAGARVVGALFGLGALAAAIFLAD